MNFKLSLSFILFHSAHSFHRAKPIICLGRNKLFSSIAFAPFPNAITNKSSSFETNLKRETWIHDTINAIGENTIGEGNTNPDFISLNKYLAELAGLGGGGAFTHVKCFHKGGRKHNYDFQIVFDGTHKFNVEFKFNAKTTMEIPQFVSPMNPSKYMSSSYEEYFYDRFLPKLCGDGVEPPPLPSKETYLSHIGSPSPKCMKQHQQLYFNGCKNSIHYTGDTHAVDFYKKCKYTASKSITAFLQQKSVSLKIDDLTTYLQKSQKNKIYMLYSNGQFILQKDNPMDYILTSTVKNAKNHRFECLTASGKTMHILLRWKNGNGLAFPSFQCCINENKNK